MKWNVEKGLGVIGLRCPNHSPGGIALWRRAVGFTALPWRRDERPPDAGSRSVARRENGARLASGACSRRRCFCSFALAVLAVLATAAPEQAAAQTVTTFLSNTGQTANTSTNTVRATAFTTGTGTYTLSSVAIYSPIQSTSPTPVVQIYRDSSGNPGTLVATMTNPATVADNTLNVYTAPANTTLAASTTYWVVTSNSVNNFGTDFRVSTNNNNNVDSGTAAGWTIGNGLFKTDVRLAPWTNSSNRHRFQIRGTAQTTPTNSAPTVANVIPDQTATAGTAFSYQFPTNTFNDTDTGDTLSYAATKADDTALPTWLAFTDSTRTFAGTPAVADTGTVSVKVTASDGNGGSISDEFDITVRDPGICARTAAVRDALLAKITGVTDCALVTATHLAAITDTLDLETKSITALADGDFDGLTALTHLDLYNNLLTALPAGVFDELTALTTLVLESNSLTALPAGVFDKLTALEGLGLTSNSLTALPDDVFDELTALTVLVLEGNSLTALPAGVFDELTALTFLDLGDNSLTALPAGVFDELTALTILYLASNSLTALPDDVFDKLTALTILGLGGNSLLTALPAGVFDELTALDALFLTGNPLTALPAGVFDKLTALTELYLNNNSLAELPDDVFQELTALLSLVLSGNPGAPFSPTAVALPDDGTVPAAGGTVMLDGSGSGGAWGTNVTYAWALTTPTSGVTVTFDSVSIAEPTVTIPPVTAGTDLVFTLTVTGRGGSNGISTATDTAAVTTTTNSAPTVPNVIPDQTATAGTAFSYQFPTNTFNDTDTGDTLSYAATKADDTALPTWLAFTDSTRTFAGTPAVADTGTVSVKVTASDGNGGSISDEFDIVVRAATTTPTAAASLVSNLGQTQHSGSLPLNSWDVVQGFETGASGYTLVSVDLRLNRQSAGTSIAVPSVKLMEGTKTATSVTLTGQPVTLTAEVAQVTSTTGENYTFTAPSGTTLSASTRYFLVVERVGTRVQWMTTASTGEDAPPASAAGWSIDDERWRRSASNTGNFTGKVARSQLLRVNGNTNTSTNAAPTVPNAIPDQTATAGTAFSYAFPDTTFNDTDTGDTLSYAATKADDTALPTWLAFTDSTRTFAGTPAVADTGTVSVKVTASDGNGGSISDEFDITVRDLGICARTEAVRDALLARIAGVTDCALVTDTHLAAITGTLDLETKSITALAAGDFDGLTALTTLILEGNSVIPGGNDLTVLPAGVFDELTALTTLNLRNNSLTALPAGVFDKLTALTDLDLSFSDLTALPAGVFDELTALTVLVLEGNSLTALPAGVFDELTALTALVLERNSLTALPAGVFDELTALTELNLFQNVLTALPDDVFDKLTALTTLILSENSLTGLPAGIFDELTALTFLFLNNNSLAALPDDVFDSLTALDQLFLSDNSLAELPDDVFQELTALASLVLSGNPGAPFSPTAVALPDDGTVPAAGGTVMLDGSGSGGAWGTNVTYAWALTTPATGVTVTFDNDSIAEPTVTIPPVTAGTDLVFTLTVTGRGGSNGISTSTDTAAVTVTAVPGAPTDLTATASGSTTINLVWKAPASDGGGAITGYKIEVSPNGTSNWTNRVANTNSTDTTYSHTGLAAGTTRHYRVSAINSVGTSTTSDVANATTNTANTAPGAPTGLTATASGTTRIDLSWTAPASTGGSAITGYKIEVSPDGTSNWTALVANTASTTTTYEHSGLAADTTLYYRVSAINSVGTSTTSNVANATTGTVIDTRPPVLTQATVNGTTLVLTYDETLDGASVPAAGAFAVTAAGSAVTVNGVGVGGSAVTLTLANAVRANQTVTLDYTPGTNPIQDGAGNDAAALSGRSVTNNTPGVGPMPRVSIGPWLLIVAEDVGDAVLTVSLDRPAASALSVAWETQDHTAESPEDFTASEGPVTFRAGETRKTISVPIVDDAVREDPVHDVHEIFFVYLSPGPGYTMAQTPTADSSVALVEIVDNDGVGSMDAADDALALVDGVTPEAAAAVLLGEQTLSEAQLAALDRLGNRNGRYDIGDLLSWIARCRRGEARCGSPSTDSGAASAAMLGAAAAGHRRIPRRRPRRRDSGRRGRCRGRASTGGIRRRARVAGYALAMLLAAMTWSCTEGSVGPVAATPDPGFLTVEWSGPATHRDVGVLLELEGPTIDDVRAPGLELYESSAPGPHRIVVAGVLRPGALVQFRVPDRNQFALYRVRVLQVTGEDYGLRDVEEYQAMITLP